MRIGELASAKPLCTGVEAHPLSASAQQPQPTASGMLIAARTVHVPHHLHRWGTIRQGRLSNLDNNKVSVVIPAHVPLNGNSLCYRPIPSPKADFGAQIWAYQPQVWLAGVFSATVFVASDNAIGRDAQHDVGNAPHWTPGWLDAAEGCL